MNWQEILTIIIPLGAFMAWIYGRLDKKFDHIDKQFADVNLQFKDVNQQFKDLKKELKEDIGTLRTELKEDIGTLRTELKEDIEALRGDVKDLNKSVQSLDSRVSHIEGQLIRMYPYEPRWEPKIIEKSKE